MVVDFAVWSDVGTEIVVETGLAPLASSMFAPHVVPLPLPQPPPPPPAPVPVPGQPAPPAPAVLPLPPRLAAPGGTWVLDEPVSGYEVGQEVTLPPNAIDFGKRTFVTIKGRLTSLTKVDDGQSIDAFIVQRKNELMSKDDRVIAFPSEGITRTLADAEKLMKKSKSDR